jgi:hypothetical protein
MAATIRQELEEEFLSTIRKGQETALEAAKPLAEAVHYVIPTMPAVRVPLASLLPTARSCGRRVRVRRAPACEPAAACRRGNHGNVPAAARQGTAEGRSRQGHRLGRESATPAGRAAPRQRRNPQFPALPRSAVRDERDEGDGP